MTFEFQMNKRRPDVYDLISDFETNLTYVKLSKPRKSFLKKNGVSYVLETWKDKEKIFFSGLIPIGPNTYSANHFNKRQNTISHMIVKFSENHKYMTIEVLRTYKKKKGLHR